MEIIDAGRVRICVSATRISGCDYVDVRVYATDLNGQLRPTGNGIPIPIDCLQQVLTAAHKEHKIALDQEPATLFYFREHVENKAAAYSVLLGRLFTTGKEAVRKTPKQHGAEEQHGFIFKSSDYTRTASACVFQPSKPFAVWDSTANKWVRWENRPVVKHRKK